MMITALVCGTLFGLGAVFAAIRLVKGPTQIDRAVALDVMLAIVVGVIVLLAAVSGAGSPWSSRLSCRCWVSSARPGWPSCCRGTGSDPAVAGSAAHHTHGVEP